MKQKSNLSIKKSSDIQTKETKLKTLSILIILGAILAGAAPFIHILFPRNSAEIVTLEKLYEQHQITEEAYTIQLSALKEKQRFIGFPNQRTFWYNLGKPITLLYFSILLIGIYPFLADKYLRKALKASAIILGFVAFYFITWVLWDRSDFPKIAYYIAMGIISVLSTYASYLLIVFRSNTHKKLRDLSSSVAKMKSRYIVGLGADGKIEDEELKELETPLQIKLYHRILNLQEKMRQSNNQDEKL